jgi:hypothetical protein
LQLIGRPPGKRTVKSEPLPGSLACISETMKQISVRWGDLGSPVQPGNYRCGPHMVMVTPGDIKLANGKPDTVFVAILPDFCSDDTPYLLTGVALPGSS